MATETKLGTIHLFPSYSSYDTNKASVATSDIALIPSTGGTIIEAYSNGTNWYRVWSDGTLQQGGVAISTGTINFLKPFANDSYTLTYGNTNGDGQGVCAKDATATSFYIANNSTNKSWQGWYAIGTVDSNAPSSDAIDDANSYTIKGSGYNDWDEDSQSEAYTWNSTSIIPSTFKTFTISGIETFDSRETAYFDISLTGSGTRPSKLYVYVNNKWLTLSPSSGTWYRCYEYLELPENTKITIQIRDTSPT